MVVTNDRKRALAKFMPLKCYPTNMYIIDTVPELLMEYEVITNYLKSIEFSFLFIRIF